ncbi:hypothetical protein FRC12_009401 [Ceratobasidium sp. 428]|nr:hypothetical protein FRC12_009401 [Ceratobasidium sp. 428]
MECLGYSYLDNPVHKPRKPRAKRNVPADSETSPSVISSPPQTVSKSFATTIPGSYSTYLAPDIPNNDTTLSNETWSFPPNPLELGFVSNLNTPLDISVSLDQPSSTQLDTHYIWSNTGLDRVDALSQPIRRNASESFDVLAPQYGAPMPSGLFQGENPPFSQGTNTTMVNRRNLALEANMPQASFDLSDSHTDTSTSSASTSYPSPSVHGSVWPSPALEQEDSSTSDEDSDTEGVMRISGSKLALDRRLSSNALPFIISSYLRWTRRTMFEPLKVAQRTRDHLIQRFMRSDESRCGTTLVAVVMESLIRDPELGFSHFPAMGMLKRRVYQRLAMVKVMQEPLPDSHAADVLAVLHDVHELISVTCLTSPLSHVVNLLHEVISVYRQTCSEPVGAPIHLPAKLLHPESVLRHYPAMDILLSLNTCRPMLLRYDVTDISDVCGHLLQVDNTGLQWMNGVPDKFLVMMARMHMLREDLAPNVDPCVINELEADIGSFKPILDDSPDSYLKVARLMVQESWRQIMYIYLYMGLCGVASNDTRVQNATKRFIRLLDGVKPGRTPDIFLIFPMTIVGVAAYKQRDRQIIRKRILGIQECTRVGTSGNDAIQTLNELWTTCDAQGRPALWSDLRLASLKATGIA